MKRYQECNWITKQIRKRWYLTVPFVSLYCFMSKKRIYIDEMIDGKLVNTNKYTTMSWKECWSISISEAQIKMNYYYTHDEVKERMKDRFGNLD